MVLFVYPDPIEGPAWSENRIRIQDILDYSGYYNRVYAQRSSGPMVLFFFFGHMSTPV